VVNNTKPWYNGHINKLITKGGYDEKNKKLAKKIIKHKYFKYLLPVFIFVLLYSLITPITGDDWGNYFVGKNGIKYSVDFAISMYKNWEGRFVSRLFLSFFTYYKPLWNILNAIQITGIIYCGYELIKPKIKTMYLLPILFLLLVNYDFFAQNYLWLAANMTYLTPTFLTIVVFTTLYKKIEIGRKTFLLFILLSIIIPMFVENIGCAYVFGLLLWNGYYFYKNRKVSKKLLLLNILSTITLLIMLLSPGSAMRMEQNISFNELNIFEKVFKNIPNLIFYIFNKNIFTLILMALPINMYLKEKIKGKKKIPIIALFNIIPVMSIIQNIRYMIPTNLDHIWPFYNGVFATNKWYFIFYWLLFTILFIVSTIKYIKNKDEKIKTILLLLIGMVSTLVMLVTPTWGDRCVIFTIIVLIFISLKIIGYKIKENKFNDKCIKIILIVTTMAYILSGIYNLAYDIRLRNYIDEVKEKQDSITIYFNRNYLLWNYTPWNELHMKHFKMYYKIEEKTNVKIAIPTIKEVVEFILLGKMKE